MGLPLRVRLSGTVLTLLFLPPAVAAGPWSRLPDAVTRLGSTGGDPAAERIVREAEESIVAAAAGGELAAVADLMAAYEEMVLDLPTAEVRLDRLRSRVAATLVQKGDELAAGGAAEAVRMWSVAARLVPGEGILERLAGVVLPPARAQPGDVWRSPVDGAELVFVPGGQTRIGCSENDRLCFDNEIYFRWVDVPDLWVERTEVTVERYRRCVLDGVCPPPALDDPPEGGRLPAVGVTWDQARVYAAWAGRRLPSEAEWERAARGAESRHRFPWGHQKEVDAANVWWRLGEESDGFDRLAPVASFPAYGWGLHDMAGNAWEWCADEYTAGLKLLPADGAPLRAGGIGRVLRGGSWRRPLDLARVSARTWRERGYFADDAGFRSVVDAGRAEPVSEVLRLAETAYPVEVEPGRQLDGAGLAEDDRRYLEQRAVTWLVLEGRLERALERAVTAPGLSGRVVEEVVRRYEAELLARADDGDGEGVRYLMRVYRLRMPELDGGRERVRRLERRLVRELRAEGQARLNAGDRRAAARMFELALWLAPEDPLLARSVRLSRIRPGTSRIWEGDGREMVWVPGGDFRMGASRGDGAADADEHPAYATTLDGFWLDRHEVTNDAYRACVEAGACTPPHDTTLYADPNLARHPVRWVDWYQARAYARWAGKRLVSETEWERAARAGAQTPYPWGLLWESDRCNAAGTRTDTFSATAPVGGLPPNDWGVHEMLGNAAEWVADLYHGSYRGAPRDGRPWNRLTGPEEPERRVVRGGSFDDPPQRVRASSRDGHAPDGWDRRIGFRCAADPDEPEPE